MSVSYCVASALLNESERVKFEIMPRKRTLFGSLSSGAKRRRIVRALHRESSLQELPGMSIGHEREDSGDVTPMPSVGFSSSTSDCDTGNDGTDDHANISSEDNVHAASPIACNSPYDSDSICEAIDEVCAQASVNPYTESARAQWTSELKDQLALWMQTEKSLPSECVTRLLAFLRVKFPSLPKNAKCLLKLHVNYSISSMGNGEYAHFEGWIQDVIKCTSSYDENISEVNLIINIDGIPLYSNTTKYTAYPILVKIYEVPEKMIVCGIYCSNKSRQTGMPCPDDLLHQFLHDYQTYEESRSTNSSCRQLKINIRAFVCDAPVRASLKGIIGHSGYHACERCEQRGRFHRGVTFLKTRCNLRTNASFADRKDPPHHKGSSPLETIKFPMVSGFILDYMHLACIGVMKRLLARLKTSNRKQNKTRLSTTAKSKFNKYLDRIRSHIPSDFARRLEGGLDNCTNWKASELRLFMLYVGICLFFSKKVVSKQIRNNYLQFAVGMKILLSENQYDNLASVRKMFKNFISDAIGIYGPSFASYNVHSLMHLPDDYQEFGNLEKFNAFAFESFLGSQIKGCLKAGFKPLQQIAKYVGPLNAKPPMPSFSKVRSSSRTFKQCIHSPVANICFRTISWKNSILRTVSENQQRDSCIQSKFGEIGLIHAIHGDQQSELSLQVQLFDKSELFENPIKSSQVGIHKVNKTNLMKWIPLGYISCKMILLPCRTYMVAQQMPHSQI